MYADSYLDDFAFLERYLPDYTSSREILAIDDISCVLDNDIFDEEKRELLQREGYLDMTSDELRAEYNRLMRIVMRRAFNEYIRINYGND